MNFSWLPHVAIHLLIFVTSTKLARLIPDMSNGKLVGAEQETGLEIDRIKDGKTTGQGTFENGDIQLQAAGQTKAQDLSIDVFGLTRFTFRPIFRGGPVCPGIHECPRFKTKKYPT